VCIGDLGKAVCLRGFMNEGLVIRIVTGILVVKIDEASEIKNGQLCIVGAQTSRFMAKGSRLMKN